MTMFDRFYKGMQGMRESEKLSLLFPVYLSAEVHRA